MEETLKESLTQLFDESDERNFTQSVDVVVTLRDIDLNDQEQQVEFYARLPQGLGEHRKIAALVGPELKETAEGVVDTIVEQSDFEDYQQDEKMAKKLAKNHAFFIAQADIMPQVASTFGKVLGPRGKMPNPQLGSVLPGSGKVKPVYERLQNQVRIEAKDSPMIQAKVGNEDMDEEDLIENISELYDQIESNLPRRKSNIKDFMIKLTMSKPVTVDV